MHAASTAETDARSTLELAFVPVVVAECIFDSSTSPQRRTVLASTAVVEASTVTSEPFEDAIVDRRQRMRP